MPSVPPVPPPRPSDAALVGRARRGERSALAALYARHADAVHATARASGRSGVAAAQVLRDVFATAGRSLPATAADDFDGWIRERTREVLSAPRGRSRRAAPATVAAVAADTGAAELDPGVRDAVWRELDRRWRRDAVPFVRRHLPALATTASLTALVLAVLTVGLLLLEHVRPPATGGAIALTAEPMEVVATEPADPPPPAPSVIVPPPSTEEPFVAPEEPEGPADPQDGAEPSPPPTPEPSPSPPSEPSPEPTPTTTEPQPEPTGTVTPDPTEPPPPDAGTPSPSPGTEAPTEDGGGSETDGSTTGDDAGGDTAGTAAIGGAT